jgi:hypothetical protein
MCKLNNPLHIVIVKQKQQREMQKIGHENETSRKLASEQHQKKIDQYKDRLLAAQAQTLAEKEKWKAKRHKSNCINENKEAFGYVSRIRQRHWDNDF